jgi:hypothetical protein
MPAAMQGFSLSGGLAKAPPASGAVKHFITFVRYR